jgi:hypothetical protein
LLIRESDLGNGPENDLSRKDRVQRSAIVPIAIPKPEDVRCAFKEATLRAVRGCKHMDPEEFRRELNGVLNDSASFVL